MPIVDWKREHIRGDIDRAERLRSMWGRQRNGSGDALDQIACGELAGLDLELEMLRAALAAHERNS